MAASEYLREDILDNDRAYMINGKQVTFKQRVCAMHKGYLSRYADFVRENSPEPPDTSSETQKDSPSDKKINKDYIFNETQRNFLLDKTKDDTGQTIGIIHRYIEKYDDNEGIIVGKFWKTNNKCF
jgi:hypothetical protein